MKKTALCAAVAMLAVTACTDSSAPTTKPEPTSQASPTTTGSAPTSTTSSTQPSTTTTVADSSNLHVSGSTLAYSIDGTVLVRGWVDQRVEVTVGGSPAPVGEDGGFEVEVTLDPGEHAIEVAALDDYGAGESVAIRVIVDPGMEVQFAYVTEVDPDGTQIVADYAEWLTGEEAIKAAEEDGEQVDPEGLPGDFYIRNRNARLRTLPLASDVVIVLLAGGDEDPFPPNTRVDAHTWSAFLSGPESAPEEEGLWWYGGGGLPYWLTIDSTGQVVQVAEHYLP